MAALKPKGRSFDETRALVRMALETKHGTGNGNGYLWLSEIYPDMTIYTVEPKLGKSVTYSATFSVAADGTVTLGEPVQVVRKNVYETVEFEMDFTAEFSADEKGCVVKEALLFRLGDYPDKGFSLDKAEAESIVIPAIKAGLELEIEHKQDTVFSGKLGKAIDSWLVGDDLFGKVSFPAAVAGLLKGTKPQFSMKFDPVTKAPIELSIVKNPRITDAGLLAAFSESEKPKVRKGHAMSFLDKLAELTGFKKADVEAEMKAEFSKDSSDLEAQLKAANAEIAALKQGVSTFGQVSAAQSAESYAKALLTAGKIVPAELASVTAAFSNALVADGGVKFSATGTLEEGPVTKAVKAAFEARPAMTLTETQFSVAPGEFKAGEKPMTADEVFAMRANGGKK
jgi:hypothetical protein